jgi:hypothetical protein
MNWPPKKIDVLTRSNPKHLSDFPGEARSSNIGGIGENSRERSVISKAEKSYNMFTLAKRSTLVTLIMPVSLRLLKYLYERWD